MTLQAGDKLMSPTDVSEMLGIPVHTLYSLAVQGRRSDRLPEWAVTCDTVERLSRLGWNSRSTNASKRGASISPRAARRHRPTVEPVRKGS
jgi:hypothetical protein